MGTSARDGGQLPQKRGCAAVPSACRREAVSRHSNGMRGRSTQRPSFASNAGSTVSEPSTDTATTRIEPTANEAKILSPARNIPDIESMYPSTTGVRFVRVSITRDAHG